MVNLKVLVIVVSIYFCGGKLNAQEMIDLPVTKDAMIRQINGIGDNTNWGSFWYSMWHAGTNTQNVDIVFRTLIDFDFGQIPNGATVLSADLHLFTDLNNSGQWSGGHTYSPNSNISTARRITSPWTEYGVTWNNQPTATLQNEIIIPKSTASHQHYTIDVTNLVLDILADTINSFGIQFKLVVETPYRKMVFASSDNATAAYHPKLSVGYNPNTSGLSGTANILNAVTVSPNPSNETFTVSGTRAKKMDFFLYDMQGREIKTKFSLNTNSDIEFGEYLPPGLYFLRITSDSALRIIKLIKSN